MISSSSKDYRLNDKDRYSIIRHILMDAFWKDIPNAKVYHINEADRELTFVTMKFSIDEYIYFKDEVIRHKLTEEQFQTIKDHINMIMIASEIFEF